ncbi:hypothetical protein E4U53_004712, partial [Claviceps sorghi]
SVGSHMLSLMGLSGLYLAWAAVGKSVTGEYPFFWMDEAQVGSKEAVSLYSIGFVLLAPMSKYLVDYGCWQLCGLLPRGVAKLT